jgi:predicted nucleic acid-binding protein
MSRVIVLDTGPLGLLTAPPARKDAAACRRWVFSLLSAGARVVLPEIADYELRRELLRARKIKSIGRLDALPPTLEYVALNTATMRQAAALWAHVRQRGRPTAGNESIDADAILAAQAISLGVADVTVATTNVGHLSRFVPAEVWENITP